MPPSEELSGIEPATSFSALTKELEHFITMDHKAGYATTIVSQALAAFLVTSLILLDLITYILTTILNLATRILPVVPPGHDFEAQAHLSHGTTTQDLPRQGIHALPRSTPRNSRHDLARGCNGSKIVAFKEVYNDEQNTWMISIGSMGAIHRVCKEAYKQAMKTRLPEYIGKDTAAIFEKRGFDIIWLPSKISPGNHFGVYLEKYWRTIGAEEDRPRKLAIPLKVWPLQMQGPQLWQLGLFFLSEHRRLKRLAISELFLVVNHEEFEDTLIEFVEPKTAKANLPIVDGSSTGSYLLWTDFERESMVALQKVMIRMWWCYEGATRVWRTVRKLQDAETMDCSENPMRGS
ncbi:uncharacterized protein PAC_17876 [Phialocephala subalpina]|uniref:Uncharacterized protein n=1 Tax=Phialocephala subalpina TaxID=576137 RepID=A0A1L7XSN8_9HELO|nr:uncharacterized protein PAC_17876 [Phialocephala subalpina]